MPSMSTPVKSLLAAKGGEVVTLPGATSLVAAAQVLKTEEIGVLVVVDEAGKPIGIVSERDIVRAVAEQGANCGDLCTRDVMSRRVVSCRPDDTLRDAEVLMHTHYIRHLPVVSDDRLVGIVSMRDIMDQRMKELRTAKRRTKTAGPAPRRPASRA
jgi:CBS domain-containing protein